MKQSLACCIKLFPGQRDYRSAFRGRRTTRQMGYLTVEVLHRLPGQPLRIDGALIAYRAIGHKLVEGLLASVGDNRPALVMNRLLYFCPATGGRCHIIWDPIGKVFPCIRNRENQLAFFPRYGRGKYLPLSIPHTMNPERVVERGYRVGELSSLNKLAALNKVSPLTELASLTEQEQLRRKRDKTCNVQDSREWSGPEVGKRTLREGKLVFVE